MHFESFKEVMMELADWNYLNALLGLAGFFLVGLGVLIG